MPTPQPPAAEGPSPGAALSLPERAELERFRLLADSVPALIAYYESQGFTCLYANRAYAATFGLTPAEAVGRTYSQIVGPDAGRKIAEQVRVLLEERRTVSYERELVDAQGARRTVEVSLVPHVAAGGAVVGAFVLISDVTRHHAIEAALRESEERMAKFTQASVEGILFHRDGVISDVNAPMEALLSLPADRVVGRGVLEFVAPVDRARAAQAMASGQDVTYELQVQPAQGEPIPVEVMGRSIQRNGQSLRMVIVRDIRDRLAAQARIHHLAHHDALTGLPNRPAFMRRLEEAIAERAASGGVLALLFVDLDHFKRINDSLGHLAGDEMLRAVGARLVESLRGSDAVGRFGGDEFMVMLADVGDRRDAEGVARKLLQVVRQPVTLAQQAVAVTPSIGIAFYPDDAGAAEDLVKHADTAMYVAKADGRAGYRFFEPAMASRAYAAIVMETELAQALRESQLELMLVPRQRLSDGMLGGLQAQIRWRHPQRGLLAPESFAAVAAERRMLTGLVAWAMQDALRLAARWRDAGLVLPAPTLDLTPLPLTLPDVVNGARRALAAAPGPSGAMALQLGEAVFGGSGPDTRRQFEQLHELAVPVDMTDFALGPAALPLLKARPVRSLGLPRALVAGMPGDAAAVSVARALIGLAQDLGLDVVADGMDQAAQRDWLSGAGCTLAQGALFELPMTVEGFERWWRPSGSAEAFNASS